MIQWVYESACCSTAERVVIATDDERVRDAAASFGAEVCLTGKHHVSGTDRIWEAAGLLDIDPESVIVNLQGDEPRIPGELLDDVAQSLIESPDASIATAAYAIGGESERDNPNVVKVVCDKNGNALYFSRSRIPYPREATENGTVYRHLGVYAYRYEYLQRFTIREPGTLEKTECLEQLRALEYGDRIIVHVTGLAPPPGIDTPEDLERFRREVDHG